MLRRKTDRGTILGALDGIEDLRSEIVNSGTNRGIEGHSKPTIDARSIDRMTLWDCLDHCAGLPTAIRN